MFGLTKEYELPLKVKLPKINSEELFKENQILKARVQELEARLSQALYEKLNPFQPKSPTEEENTNLKKKLAVYEQKVFILSQEIERLNKVVIDEKGYQNELKSKLL